MEPEGWCQIWHVSCEGRGSGLEHVKRRVGANSRSARPQCRAWPLHLRFLTVRPHGDGATVRGWVNSNHRHVTTASLTSEPSRSSPGRLTLQAREERATLDDVGRDDEQVSSCAPGLQQRSLSARKRRDPTWSLATEEADRGDLGVGDSTEEADDRRRHLARRRSCSCHQIPEHLRENNRTHLSKDLRLLPAHPRTSPPGAP